MSDKLWLWKNFVGGRPEYWAFEHLYPINMDNGDPQTLGEPCGYALLKPSRPGRTVCPNDEQCAIAGAAAQGTTDLLEMPRDIADYIGTDYMEERIQAYAKRYALAAVAQEREQCALEAEHWQTISKPEHKCGEYIAAAIRGRSRIHSPPS